MGQTYPVYVVDDDPSVHEWAKIVCEERALSCRCFRGGEEFLKAVDTLPPGCLLLDMRMPGMSGLQVQTELVKRGVTMPVVAMTGFGDVDVAVQCMKLGAVDFLEKPFPQDTLFEALDQSFKRLDALAAKPTG